MADAPTGRPETIHIMNGHEPGFNQHSNGVAVRPPERLPVKNSIESVVKDMAAVRRGGIIALYCGEAHPDVYNSESFLIEAHKLTEEMDAKITAITGPVVLVPDDERAPNGLIQLMENRTLDGLYHRRARFTTGHFRVVETDGIYKLYREETHAPGQDVETRWCDNIGRYSDESIQAQARDALYRFETWKSMAVPHALAKEQGLPLITTPKRLAKIVAHVRSKDLDFNYLEAAEILELAREIGPNLIKPLTSYKVKAKRRS